MADWIGIPTLGAFMVGGILIAIVLIAFWIWMIIDCATRRFKKDWEKIVWILVIIFVNWVGAIAYFIVIRLLNPRGLIAK